MKSKKFFQNVRLFGAEILFTTLEHMFLNLRHLYIICSAIKDGYESDGALVFKRRESQNTPRSQTPAEAKTAYNQIQKGI